MLIGIAIGDAYGAPFENLSYKDAGEKLKSDGFVSGRYTDDTQQALAIAELLVSGDEITPFSLAESFLSAYNRDKRSGYSRVTRAMLASPDPESFLVSMSEQERENRKTDGAAMRAPPLGFLPERIKVIEAAKLSASITHGHPDAIAATVAVSLIAHERYYRATPYCLIWDCIRDEIEQINPDIISYCDTCARLKTPDREIILGEHAGYGVPYTESKIFLGAVIFLLASYGDDPHRLLIESILLGGDTDTVAAVVLGAALIRGAEENNVWSLIPDLEDGPFGKEYLMMTGDQLTARYPSGLSIS